MIAWCHRVVSHFRCTDEAYFCLDVVFLLVLLLPLHTLPFTFYVLGIFGQAITEAAATAQTRRWWYWGSWSIFGAGNLSLALVLVGYCTISSVGTTAPS